MDDKHRVRSQHEITPSHLYSLPGNHSRNAAIQKQLSQGKEGGYAVKSEDRSYADMLLDLLFNKVTLDPRGLTRRRP
ncbi:hypothetical protein J4Q44_G00363950 [Coregonus suidteri]|uniref:Uncharacterized protein n=1 Tax=Coregonus suidteri TaxID=861788 RepID=A0AAN8Q632_9TELE